MFQKGKHFIEFVKKILEVNQLVYGVWYKFKFLVFGFPILVFQQMGMQFSFSLFLKLYYKNIILKIFLTDLSDFFILREMFIREDYTISFSKEPKIIFDLGSNVGFSALYFHACYPNATIYAFEPVPQTFTKMVQNTRNISHIIPMNLAVSDREGTLPFFVHPRSMSSSLVQRLPNQHSINVPTKTLDVLFDELKIEKVDLMKFDIEGGEYSVFKNFVGKNKVQQYIGEVHLNLIPVSKEAFLELFKERKVSILEEEHSTAKFILSVK